MQRYQRRWGLVLACLFLVTLLMPGRTHAQGEGTPVSVDLYLNDLSAIDTRAGTFEVDAYLIITWLDPLGTARDGQFQGEAVSEQFKGGLWWPDLDWLNIRGERTRLLTALDIEDGFVTYSERFRATFNSDYDLTEFPFDSQELVMALSTFSFTTEDLVYDPVTFQNNITREPQEWSIEGMEAIPAIDEGEGVDEPVYPLLFFTIQVERLSGYYLWKIILPLILIVAISWAVFWMDFEQMTLADRLSVSFTSVLTVVAFNFVTGDSLPRIEYLTFLDSVTTATYVFMALAVLENVLAYVFVRRDRPATAQRLDLVARIAFPLSYGLVYLALYILFLY